MISTNLGSINQYPTWTTFKIKNGTTKIQKLILQNPRATLDEVDVYIVDQKGKISSYFLGDMRDLDQAPLPHRYSIVSVELQPFEEIAVYTRLINRIGSTEGEWLVHTERHFYGFSIAEGMWWGLYVGFQIALLFYAIPILMNVRDKVLSYYFSGYVISSSLYQLTLNGVLHSFNIFPSHYSNVVTLMLGALFGLFTVLFMWRYLSTRQASTILKIFLYMTVFDVGAQIFFILLSPFDSAYLIVTSKIGIYTGLLAYLLWFALLRDFIKLANDKIFQYLMFGYTIVFFAYTYQTLVNAGIVPMSVISQYSVSFTTLVESYFFLLGITEMIKDLEKNRLKNQKIMESNLCFASIGKMIGNISHQWKVPLVRLGAYMTHMETLMQFKSPTLQEDITKILPDMRSNLIFMQQTIDEFYGLYTNSSKSTLFDPSSTIHDVWSLINAKALMVNASYDIKCDGDRKVKGYEHFIAHVMMIIIDNFLDVAKRRNIESAHILIKIVVNSEKLFIRTEDNCGGIRQHPLDSIFDLDVSSKASSDEKGGMGLYIAHTIVTEKLEGEIFVSNTLSGASFTISIPQQD